MVLRRKDLPEVLPRLPPKFLVLKGKLQESLAVESCVGHSAVKRVFVRPTVRQCVNLAYGT